MCEYARYTAGTIRQYRTTGHLLRTGMLFQAGYLHDLLGRFLCGSDFIPFDFDFFLRACSFSTDKQRKLAINFSEPIHSLCERYPAQKAASP